MKSKIVFFFALFNEALAVQEFVAEAFSSFDFDHKHSPSIKLLLFVLFGFLSTFVFLIVIIFIFRGVMNWMGYNNNNSRRYELPFHNPVVVQPEEIQGQEMKKDSYQNILVHSELIKMQAGGTESPLSPFGMTKVERRELARLLAGSE
ncbi:unnamed protein product, partial [Mesorhabditis belari]|uniref:Uncharacterized protein n=1 Tax=Mesorhabditis belari TaxID=2138241 RepID=A0AAF3EK88_9BILA